MPWKPAHEAHAIERASVTFQFVEAVPSKLWQSMLNRTTLEYQGKGFNSIAEGLEFNFNPLVAGQAMALPAGGMLGWAEAAPQVIGGHIPALPGGSARTFRALVGNQVREEVSLSQSRLSYSSAHYDRWKSFEERIYDLLEPLLDSALQVTNLSIIKMEYWDRFVFEGPPTQADYREVLRSDSKYLPSFFFETNELWHSHVGHFIPDREHVKRLININIDALDVADIQPPTSSRRSIGIYSMGQDTFESTLSLALPEAKNTLDSLHVILKNALANVILPEMAERIGLNGKIGT